MSEAAPQLCAHDDPSLCTLECRKKAERFDAWYRRFRQAQDERLDIPRPALRVIDGVSGRSRAVRKSPPVTPHGALLMRKCQRWECTECGMDYVADLRDGCICGGALKRLGKRWNYYTSHKWRPVRGDKKVPAHDPLTDVTPQLSR